MTLKTGAVRNYKTGPKNHARRFAWNRLLERTAGTEKTNPILYLAGPQDLDRQIAISKGVPSTNLIAIDHAQRNIMRVRRAGGVAICSEVLDVLEAWPSPRTVSAIVLDLCCGLELEMAQHLVKVLYRAPFSHAWVWLNLQRGRDHSSNLLRSHLAAVFGPLSEGPELWQSDRNRAAQFFRSWAIGDMVAANLGDRIDEGRFAVDLDVARTFLTVKVCGHQPIFHSYRSHGDNGTALVFDTIIFSARPLALPIKDTTDFDRQVERGLTPSSTAQRLVRAALAVRTMREDR